MCQICSAPLIISYKSGSPEKMLWTEHLNYKDQSRVRNEKAKKYEFVQIICPRMWYNSFLCLREENLYFPINK